MIQPSVQGIGEEIPSEFEKVASAFFKERTHKFTSGHEVIDEDQTIACRRIWQYLMEKRTSVLDALRNNRLDEVKGEIRWAFTNLRMKIES